MSDKDGRPILVQVADSKKKLAPPEPKKVEEVTEPPPPPPEVEEVKETVVEEGSQSDSDEEVKEEIKPTEEEAKELSKEEIAKANLTERPSNAPSIGGPKRSCCYRFWNAIFKLFAHDRIYGSFVGPHPVSFLCCCLPCKSCCKGTCIRPFILASVATKSMWFIMLLVIMILSCFFIIPYPKEAGLDPIRDFFPCNDGETEENGKKTSHYRKVNDRLKMDCSAHGGFFMVYRNFFAFCFLLLVSGLIMINVQSTNLNRKRAKMHHGFWMYKYIILFVLLLICYLGIRVEAGGVFEYLVSWIGLLSALVFSVIELTFLLDLVESYAAKNRTSKDDWADCLYWTFTTFVLLVDIGILAAMCIFYSTDHYTEDGKPLNENDKRKVNGAHVGIIAYAIFMSIILIAMAVYNRQRSKFLYTGFLQTAFVISYQLGVIWSALGNSPEITSRPHFNPYKNSTLEPQPGSEDVYFKAEAFFHGASVFITLILYVFWNFPRSKTAPLSILLDKVMYCKAKKPELPVIPPPEDAPEEFSKAIDELIVWDDEKTGVRYSWTMLYVVMILGSFSIMMAMCNFSDPWAISWYASSIPAFSIKIVISFAVSLTYILFTTFPCRKIFPELFVETPTISPPADEKTELKASENDNKEVVINVPPESTDEKVPTDEPKPDHPGPQAKDKV